MDTFPKLLSQQAADNPEKTAIRHKKLGVWQSQSWGELASAAAGLSSGMKSKGVGPGSRVGVIGANLPEMFQAILAAQQLSAVVVPMHPDSTGDALAQTLTQSECEMVIAQDQQQVDAVLEVRGQCPALKTVIYLNGRGMENYEGITKLSDMIQEDVSAPDVSTISGDTPAFIFHTAGTSGTPKGVVLSNAAMIDRARSLTNTENLTIDDEILAFLPMSMAASMLYTYAISLVTGCTLSCPESNETVLIDMQEIGPTVLYAPPFVYKDMVSSAESRIQSAGKLKYSMYHAALASCMKIENKKITTGTNIVDALLYQLHQLLVFAPMKSVNGLSRLRVALAGGDSIAPYVFSFFRSIGINLKHTYGTTETAACITIQEDGDEGHNVGVPVEGVELKIDEGSGELLVKGVGMFDSYYNNPEATAGVKTSDGWIRTGDLASYDENNNLVILDNISEVGSMSNGTKFTPKIIEVLVSGSPFIKQCVAIGDGRGEVTAIIVMHEASLNTWADRQGIRYTGFSDLASRDEVYTLAKEHLNAVNAELDSTLQIKRFVILNRELNIANSEVTRARSLQRDNIHNQYSQMIEALYSGAKEYKHTDDDREHKLPIMSTM